MFSTCQTIAQKATDLPTYGPKQVTHLKKCLACRLSALRPGQSRLTTSHFNPSLPDPALGQVPYPSARLDQANLIKNLAKFD